MNPKNIQQYPIGYIWNFSREKTEKLEKKRKCYNPKNVHINNTHSHSIDICTVPIKNIKNMHAVSTNQIADILHFNNKVFKKLSKN